MQLPYISKSKYLLITAIKASGVILNNDFTIYTNSGDNFFVVADELGQARLEARNKIKDSAIEIEVSIFDHDKNVIEIIG